MRPDEDPGWGPALAAAAYAIVPFAGPVIAKRRKEAQTGLLVLRTIFVSLVAAPPLFVVAFSFVCPWDGGDEGAGPWVVGTVGLICIAANLWLMRRDVRVPPDLSTASLASQYRTRMLIGVGIADLPVLISIAATFAIQNSLWLIVLGAALTLAALGVVAPSRTNIARDQGRLREQGSALDLTRALNAMPPRGGRPETSAS